MGDWVVRACTNCDTDVYILHTVKESRVFATKSLLVRSGCVLGCDAYGLCVRGSILKIFVYMITNVIEVLGYA